jgi:tRNA A-37 threonylcarbamoyl transferase component Bud32
MALQIGERIGDYEVVALIGAGGMGRVYKARNIISNRDEAMKVLLPDLTSERDVAVRFMLKIRTLAGLDHPNIAQLRTAFQFQNQLVMIMEYVEGVTLEKLATESPIPLDRVLDYATQVLSALSFAHSHGVTHRDIKPANIMITTHGLVKLMDFGIAKNADEMHLTRPGMTIGSVYYMSPEQVRGGTVDARSDIYSFGVTLYELITGRKPFQADTSYSVLNAHCNEAPVPPNQVNPSLPAELNSIVLRSMEKNPADRYQTAQEFHDALKALRTGQAAAPRLAAVPAPTQGFTPVPTYADSLSATAAVFTPVPGTAASSTAAPAQAPAAGPVPVPAPASAQAPPAFAPVAAARPAPAKAKSHRGLWIGLGALAAILALVAVAVVLPRLYSILAKQRAAASTPAASMDSSSTPAPTPQPTVPTTDATPAATPTDGSAAATPQTAIPGQAGTPAGNPAPQPQGAGSGGQHRPSYSATQSSGAPSQAGSRGANSGGGSPSAGGAGGGGVASGPTAPSVPAGPSPQEIREVKDRLSNLDARVDSARAGVQSIRTQQQAQGLDIRGDILAAMNRLNSDMREAQAALGQNDLKTAGEYLDRADRETATLEKFLGR